jgi:hypothetical protein
MNILIKYPSRGRPERFFEGLNSIVDNIADANNYHVSLTLDLDDPTMNNKEVVERINSYQNVSIQWGLSDSKIHAVNRDLPEWGDIILVESDDFRFTFWGFDQIIRQQFEDGDFDKLIHIPDTQAKHHLATMYIAGRTFYNRFGFIYDPRFKSLWCDNLIMDISKHLGKYHYVDIPGVILHLNPAYGGHRDELFDLQQSFWNEDEATYNKIKSSGLDNYLLNFPK